MSLLKQHINLRKGVYNNIIKLSSLQQSDRLLDFISHIPKLPSNSNYRTSTALPHHLKLHMLKAKLKRKREPLLQQSLQNAFARFNGLRFPNVPRCSKK